MKVLWTQTAIHHLAAISEYIGQDSKRYARRMVDRITARSRQIPSFPASGQTVPEYEDPNIRQVIEGPYRILYSVTASEVQVLAVIHGARLLPPTPPGETHSPGNP